MRFYKTMAIDNQIPPQNVKSIVITVMANNVVYTAVEEGMLDPWSEVTETEYVQAVGKLPTVMQFYSVAGHLAEAQENQLIFMDALATTFEEVLALREFVEGGTA